MKSFQGWKETDRPKSYIRARGHTVFYIHNRVSDNIRYACNKNGCHIRVRT